MENKLMGGKLIADKINSDVSSYIQKNNIKTSLAILLEDDRPDSLT